MDLKKIKSPVVDNYKFLDVDIDNKLNIYIKKRKKKGLKRLTFCGGFGILNPPDYAQNDL